jgi:hypothetical protein
MCSGLSLSSEQKQVVFYGTPDGALYKEVAPTAREASVESLCTSLFKQIPFTDCRWYLESLDYLVTTLNQPPLYKKKKVAGVASNMDSYCSQDTIRAKIEKLSEIHLKLLCKKEHVSRHSSSESVIASLYEAAGQQILFKHPPDPCVCQVD